MAAGCCYQADGSCAELVFHMRAGSYDEDSLIEFVGELHAHLAGQKVTLLWDGLPSHRSRKMKRYLASQRRWLVVERLPAYAPELNPVEKLWANLKGAGAGEPLRRDPRRADQGGTARRRAGPQRRGSALRLPQGHRTLALILCLDPLNLHR
jgi:putative transposase